MRSERVKVLYFLLRRVLRRGAHASVRGARARGACIPDRDAATALPAPRAVRRLPAPRPLRGRWATAPHHSAVHWGPEVRQEHGLPKVRWALRDRIMIFHSNQPNQHPRWLWQDLSLGKTISRLIGSADDVWVKSSESSFCDCHVLSPGQTVLPTQANSSQVTKSKLASAGAAKSSQLARKSFNCLTTTAQSPKNNKTTWRELAEVAKRWKIWLELCENYLSLIKFKPTRAYSSQVGGQTIPISIEVVNLARVGLSWEDRLARALVARVSMLVAFVTALVGVPSPVWSVDRGNKDSADVSHVPTGLKIKHAQCIATSYKSKFNAPYNQRFHKLAVKWKTKDDFTILWLLFWGDKRWKISHWCY